MIPKDVLYKNVITFSVGNLFEGTGFSGKKNLNNLKQLLLLLGYERNDMVENRGQFSIRGGIVDIGLSEKTGVRIEFWGDEVDSIRYFSIASQRTTEMTDKIRIFPAHEYVLEYEVEDNILPEYSKVVLPVVNNIKENCIQNVNKSNIEADIEAIQNGELSEERYTQYIKLKKETEYIIHQNFRNSFFSLDLEKNFFGYCIYDKYKEQSFIYKCVEKYLNKNPYFLNSLVYRFIRKVVKIIDKIADFLHKTIKKWLLGSKTFFELRDIKYFSKEKRILLLAILLGAFNIAYSVTGMILDTINLYVSYGILALTLILLVFSKSINCFKQSFIYKIFKSW